MMRNTNTKPYSLLPLPAAFRNLQRAHVWGFLDTRRRSSGSHRPNWGSIRRDFGRTMVRVRGIAERGGGERGCCRRGGGIDGRRHPRRSTADGKCGNGWWSIRSGEPWAWRRHWHVWCRRPGSYASASDGCGSNRWRVHGTWFNGWRTDGRYANASGLDDGWSDEWADGRANGGSGDDATRSRTRTRNNGRRTGSRSLLMASYIW